MPGVPDAGTGSASGDRVQAVILAYETGIVVPGDPSARP